MQTSAAYKPGQFLLFGLFLAGAIMLADQYTKWLVLETVLRTTIDAPDFSEWFFTRRPLAYFIDQRENYNTDALAPFLNFTMVWNQGISFGLFDANHPALPFALIGLTVIICMGLVVWLVFAGSRLVALALSMVVGWRSVTASTARVLAPSPILSTCTGKGITGPPLTWRTAASWRALFCW